MIIGIGNDLVDVRRVEKVLLRHGKRFEERCFTPIERARANKRLHSGTHVHVYARRFAAKEACAKALGTGFAMGVAMRDIGVIEDENGRPFLELKNGALKRLKDITPQGMDAVLHLSLSDEPPMAQAFVIIEARMSCL